MCSSYPIKSHPMQDCNVCVETKNEKYIIECPKCQYKSCRKCTETYLLGSHFDAHCMNCRNLWDRRFLSVSFTKQFLTRTYKVHRANVLFEREKSLFPVTMENILEDQRRENILREYAELRKAQAELQRKMDLLQQQLHRRPISKETRNEFVRPCIYEGCKGYISETSGKCGLCENFICIDCNIQLTEEDRQNHECKEEDIRNWRFIRQSSKPCPSCHVRIHRIAGCRQMWCPQCHTAFDYITGEIEKGVIHNPHYFDYIRRTGNVVPVDREEHVHRGCGNGLVPFFQVQAVIQHLKTQTEKDRWMNFYRCVAHVARVELPKLREYRRHAFHDMTLDLRKSFMRNKMEESVYKKKLQEYEKKWNKKRLLSEIFDCFETVGRQLLLDLVRGENDSTNEREELRKFFNDSVSDLNSQYQSVLPILNDAFHFESDR